MSNAVNKFFFMAAIVAIGLGFTACGESKEEKEAKEMLALATEYVAQGEYSRAMELLDTIPQLFPKQIKVRQAAFDLRPSVIELATDQELEQCEQYINNVQNEFGEAKLKMKRVDNPELVEGYWVPEGFNTATFMSTTGIQPRVNDDGSFNIISEVNGAGDLHHNSITLKAQNGEAYTVGPVAFDNELNYRIGNSETVTFSGAKTDSLGLFARNHYNEPMQLTFNGEKGKKRTINLKAEEVNGIAHAYTMSEKQKEGKALMAKHMQLERKKAAAVDQQLRRNNTR